MSILAGEQAKKTENIRCEACRDTVRVEKGDFVVACTSCGNNSFESRKSKGHSGSGKRSRQPQPA